MLVGLSVLWMIMLGASLNGAQAQESKEANDSGFSTKSRTDPRIGAAYRLDFSIVELEDG
jgi:hypothetical protein